MALEIKTKDEQDLLDEILAHCDTIIETSDRMTSGNYMHHKNQQKFSAKVIKSCIEELMKK
jgi:hypothetical protein